MTETEFLKEYSKRFLKIVTEKTNIIKNSKDLHYNTLFKKYIDINNSLSYLGNILISDIPTYVSVLNDGGQLLLSGLCFFDVDDILEVCTEQNLTLERKLQREEWVSLLLKK